MKKIQDQIGVLQSSPDRHAVVIICEAKRIGYKIATVDDIIAQPLFKADELLVAKLKNYDKATQIPVVIMRDNGIETKLVVLNTLAQL